MTISMVFHRKARFEPATRRWLIVNATLIPLVANAILNGGIAWLISLGERTVSLVSVPLLKKPSTMTDTLGTLFILPFVTGLLATLSVRSDQRAGHLPLFEIPPRLGQMMARLPDRLLRRAGVFGAICLGWIGPFAALVLALDGFGGITQPSFVFYKIIFGVAWDW